MNKTQALHVAAILMMASVASAATVWNPAANDVVPPAAGNWNVAANWTNDVPGVVDGKAVFNVPGAAECVVTDAQTLVDLVQGDGGPGGVIRVLDGGNLTTTGGWMSIGFNDTARLIVEEGGVCNFAGHLWWGMHTGADSVVEINGGIINNGQSFGLGEWFGGAGDHGQCKVYIHSGALNIHHWTGGLNSDHPVFRNDSLIDIKFGKMTVVTDVEAEAQEYIDAGKITGFGKVGSARVVRANGLTTITAVDPMSRFPEWGQVLPAGDIELSWDNIDPNHPGAAMTAEVWFGTDPNKFSDDYQLVGTLDVTGESHSALTVSAPQAGTYYWQIDTDNGGEEIVVGDVLKFEVASDLPPFVDAGADMITWTDEPVALTPIVDDDHPGELTYQWTADPTEGVAFAPDAQSQAPVVTVDHAAGAVALTLTVTDAVNPPVSDTMTVMVYENACEAARVGLGQAADYPMDVVPDCIVNLLDLAEMAAMWLEDYALTGPIPAP